MTTQSKYENFVKALRSLCLEHGVMLAPSGYDLIQVLELREGDDPIWQDSIEDMTNARNQQTTKPSSKL